MHNAVEVMLKRYRCESLADHTNALKEIIQEIMLLGLWRSKFFEKAAFYGGTALRIMYGLDRFSEDMDFSLLSTDLNFKLEQYNEAVQKELMSFGFDVEIEKKEKSITSHIQSAFIKAGTKQQLLLIEVPSEIISSIHRKQKIKIKMEIDIAPPGSFEVEMKTILQPIPFVVNTYTLPCLFAGKVHAVLCRAWEKRIKGRDWYDFVWYISRDVSLDLIHLRARLEQSGHWPANEPFNSHDLIDLLLNKIKELDIEQAKKDVMPFLQDPASVAVWTPDFFCELVGKMKTI